jgi:hypothetical protein
VHGGEKETQDVLLHLIADFGSGDLAFAEVHQHLAVELPEATVVSVPVAHGDTLSAGFCIAQLGLNDGPDGRVVLHSVGDGRLAAAFLANGTLVLGPNVGCALSFVAQEARLMSWIDLPGPATSFRTRDLLPGVLGRLVEGDESVLGRPLHVDDVEPIPPRQVVYVDGHGDLVTSWSGVPFPSGTEVRVTIGHHSHAAIVGGAGLEIPAGQLTFGPASSGWTSVGGARRSFYEVFLRSGHAAGMFGHPPAGVTVDIAPIR